MQDNGSILSIIRGAIENGELPQSFSLPKEDVGNVRFADGALDGIGIYHMAGPQFTDEDRALIARAMDYVNTNDFNEAVKAMDELFERESPLRSADELIDYIYANTDKINANLLHAFAEECLYSREVDLVKLGMLLLEVFQEPDDDIKDIIRTLGLSDELTIFAVFNMRHWQGADEEIFELAKHVHGWGRIHAVENLTPVNDEMKDWLLYEGMHNEVLDSYSAYQVYRNSGAEQRLKRGASGKELDAIAEVIKELINEGPVPAISLIEDAGEMLLCFVGCAAGNPPTESTVSALEAVRKDKRFKAAASEAKKVLAKEGFAKK